MEPISNFLKSAQGLTRNPLGIIALFISLIYGMASIVLVFSSVELDSSQKWTLIIFLVVFPIIVLASFIFLVIKHHKKLYSPSDFRDDESFLGTLDREEQVKRIDKEVNELINDDNQNQKNGEPTENNTENKKIKSPISSHACIRQNYILAEDLALRQLEIEFGHSIKRQVVLKSNNYRIEFDAIANYNSQKPIAIEVKYINGKYISKKLAYSIKNILKEIEEINVTNKTSISLILAVVYEQIDVSTLKNELANILISSNVLINLRLYDFSDLKKNYGLF